MQAQPVSIDEFGRTIIPQIINGKARLRVLFSTYNEIPGYNDGPVKTKDPNLEIAVVTGGVQPIDPGLIFGSMGRALAAAAAFDIRSIKAERDFITQDARQGQEEVDAKLTDQADKQRHPDVAVIYAGYSAFRQAVETLERLHLESPDTFIVVLTCDCDVEKKRGVLGTIDGIGAIIITPNCGGRGDMRNLLDEFVAQWPNRTLLS